MTTKPTPKQRAVIDFWDDEKILPILDVPGNFWDRCNWWQKVLVVCLAVILCGLVGGMAASHLVGPK